MAARGTYNFPQQSVASLNPEAATQFARRTEIFAISNSRVWTGNRGRSFFRNRVTHASKVASTRRGIRHAEAGEKNADVSEGDDKSEESKPSLPKGFGSPHALLKDTKRSSSKSASGSIRRAPPSKPVITTQVSDQSMLQTESRVVSFLGILFVVIIVQGLTLAASGFLPEYDEIISKFLYPAFSPTVGFFFIVAAGYGLWKFSKG